jgi:transcriptional regulator with XRE-family HTH domain
MGATALGEFLRARREQLGPGEVGLAWSGRRRVPGLRREEVATLAGVSADYYLRLEQGRVTRPSAQVVDALARALQLDDDASAHLHALVGQLADGPGLEGRDGAPGHVKRLISTWSHTPALVHDRCMDVLAANAVMTALTPVVRPGANLMRATFLEPTARERRHDWATFAAFMVARLRQMAGADLDSPRLTELVDELSEGSPEFRELWARHEVVVGEPPRFVFDHPTVGRIELDSSLFAIVGVDGLFLIAQRAQPGSASEQALARLAVVSARED